MKYIKIIIFSLIIFLIGPKFVFAEDKIDLYLFYSSECIHCTHEKEFLYSIEEEYNLEIHYYKINDNKDNSKLMHNIKEIFGTANLSSVPFLVIGDESFTGYNDTVKDRIIESIKNYDQNGCNVVESFLKNGSSCLNNNNQKEDNEEFIIPLIGSINAKNVSLPLISMIIGLIDGFNPCAMWVLLFLISILIGMKDRKKMWSLGLTFLITSAIVYYLLMASWLGIAISLSQIKVIRIIIALVAIVGGIINLKSYFKKSDTGCEVVDNKRRKKIFNRIKRFTSEKSFFLSMLGIIGVAISVNIIELACSAGLPLLYTQILAVNNLSWIHSNILIFIYLLFFLLDDLIVFFIAMKTLKIKGISNKYSKYSHLIGGIIMLIIGILLIFKPEWIMFNF